MSPLSSCCVLATGELVDVDDLPDEVRHHQSLVIASQHVRPLRDVEREHILAALERNNGNRILTAEQLEIGPATLFRKLKRYGDGPWSLLLVAEAWARVAEFIARV